MHEQIYIYVYCKYININCKKKGGGGGFGYASFGAKAIIRASLFFRETWYSQEFTGMFIKW